MFFRLALLFVVVPLLELALLIQVGRWMGLLPTVALVVVTGILGAALARLQGLATLMRFRRAMDEGRLPHRELVEGVFILMAGAVLLTPGLLTDAAGFLLLVPPVRRALAARVERWLQGRARVVVTRAESRGRGWGPGVDPLRDGPRGEGEDVVDVDFEVREEEASGRGAQESVTGEELLRDFRKRGPHLSQEGLEDVEELKARGQPPEDKGQPRDPD